MLIRGVPFRLFFFFCVSGASQLLKGRIVAGDIGQQCDKARGRKQHWVYGSHCYIERAIGQSCCCKCPRKNAEKSCITSQPTGWLMDWCSKGKSGANVQKRKLIEWNISAMLSCCRPSRTDEIYQTCVKSIHNREYIIFCLVRFELIFWSIAQSAALCQYLQLHPVAISPSSQTILPHKRTSAKDWSVNRSARKWEAMGRHLPMSGNYHMAIDQSRYAPWT